MMVIHGHEDYNPVGLNQVRRPDNTEIAGRRRRDSNSRTWFRKPRLRRASRSLARCSGGDVTDQIQIQRVYAGCGLSGYTHNPPARTSSRLVPVDRRLWPDMCAHVVLPWGVVDICRAANWSSPGIRASYQRSIVATSFQPPQRAAVRRGTPWRSQRVAAR